MERTEHTIDATDKVAGRLASRVATLLHGKHKAGYAFHKDLGDSVIIKNIRGLKYTGKKMSQKVYHRFSGYPGGITSRGLKELFTREPMKVFRKMVYDMLPKNKLRSRRIKRLRFTK